MDDLYLILHKVRGEPAFDVAQKCWIGIEEAWIIPTSGHRAYPAKGWQLNGLKFGELDVETDAQQTDLSSMPDHYGVKPAEPRRDLRSILDRILPRKPFTKRPL